ncbi:hypothetical protein OSB04_003208 [Centaurea solstitialis]|uniref:Uncharacterized protein n=1 Tax=Centaurea solstitialis TaxID=347529 RepID=A0AA38WN04_9ASTR|nr:hypothetical protein OSB04_003208 [Centaurea solstitialis]
MDDEMFEVASLFHVVEMKKLFDDTLEYNNFCNQDLWPSHKDNIWTWEAFKVSLVMRLENMMKL